MRRSGYLPLPCRFLSVAALVMLSIGAWAEAVGCSTDGVRRLQPFTTAGCSLAPDLDFRDCCVAHDYLYWKGGTSDDRAEADRQFRSCIGERSEWPSLRFLYYAAVRLGGHQVWRTPFRWGFGWPGNRPAKPLKPFELAQIEARTFEYLTEHCMACNEGNAESCGLLGALGDVLPNEIEEACTSNEHHSTEPGSGVPG